MSDNTANQAVQDYLSDLLGGGVEGQVAQPSLEKPCKPEAQEAGNVSVTNKIASPDRHDAVSEQPEFGNATGKCTLQQRESVEPKPIETEQSELAVLEQPKRQKLERMLIQQTVPEVAEKQKTLTENQTTEMFVQERQQVDQTLESELEQVERSAYKDKLLDWADNGKPLWAQEAFEVLLFEVSGLSLAVPLVALGQIVPLTKNITSLQGQSAWFMGILPSDVGDIRTINTALFVMPERYDERLKESAKYVVTIDGMPWGLAVDAVNQPITLDPADVKWRSERSSRPWLAGTVKSQMCALIDIPQMAETLERSDRNRDS